MDAYDGDAIDENEQADQVQEEEKIVEDGIIEDAEDRKDVKINSLKKKKTKDKSQQSDSGDSERDDKIGEVAFKNAKRRSSP